MFTPVNAALIDPPADSPDLRIAHVLQARGRLKDVDLARAQRLQADAGGSLVGLLVRLGMVSERDMADASSEVLNLPLVLSKDCPEVPPPNVTLSVRFMKQQAVCPIGDDQYTVDLLVADPLDGYAMEAVQLATGRAAANSGGMSR